MITKEFELDIIGIMQEALDGGYADSKYILVHDHLEKGIIELRGDDPKAVINKALDTFNTNSGVSAICKYRKDLGEIVTVSLMQILFGKPMIWTTRAYMLPLEPGIFLTQELFMAAMGQKDPAIINDHGPLYVPGVTKL